MDGSALERLVSQARRRSVFNLVFDQSMQAFALALAGAVLLLVTGTQLLSWVWLLVLFLAALAYGLYRVRSRMPHPYAIAQRIDKSLSLNDALSTAWHFRLTDEDVFSAEVKDAQRKQAEQEATKIDASIAIPVLFPKSLRWCAILATAAVTLFLVRYGVQQSLDLSRPLVAFNLDPFANSSAKEQAANLKKNNSQQMEDFMKSLSVQPPEKLEEKGLDPAPDSALGTVDVPDVNNDDAKASNKTSDQKGPGSGESSEKPESGEQGEGASSSDSKNADNGQGKGDDSKGQNQQNAKTQQAPQPGENSSLMDKMKDALANMMSKLNQPQKQQNEQSQQAQNSKGSQPSGNARQQQTKQGSQSKSEKSGEQQQAANQQGNQDMQESDPSQSAQGKPGDRNSQQASSQDNKSGMGKQDGSKDVKLAEQLAAMGKISEIIGKRNEKLQGEIMVEVNSSKQSLRTQYTDRNARHAEAGGEIHRDEVPLIYQNYVQQYFDEVRKAPPSARAKPSSPAKPLVTETP